MNHDHSSHEHPDDTEGKISRSKLVTLGFLLVIGYFLWTEHQSATILLFYTLCTLVWLVLPDPFMNFMNALFLGLDFRRLQTGEPLSWWPIVYPGILFAVWFFAAGSFFACLYNALGGDS